MRSYSSVNHVIPTSNVCERLFSIAKHVATDTRTCILDATLEADIILLMNKDLWNEMTIDALIKSQGSMEDDDVAAANEEENDGDDDAEEDAEEGVEEEANDEEIDVEYDE